MLLRFLLSVSETEKEYSGRFVCSVVPPRIFSKSPLSSLEPVGTCFEGNLVAMFTTDWLVLAITPLIIVQGVSEFAFLRKSRTVLTRINGFFAEKYDCDCATRSLQWRE